MGEIAEVASEPEVKQEEMVQSFGDWVWIRPVEEEKSRPMMIKDPNTGVFRPTAPVIPPLRGTVVYHGPKCSSSIQIGSEVIFAPLSGIAAVVNDEPLIVMKEEIVLGVVKKV